MSSRFGDADSTARPIEDLHSDHTKPERSRLLPIAANWKDISDEDLAAQLANGQHDALTELFERYSRLVFGIARRILKDDGEAEEALQQVFLDIFRSIDKFDPHTAAFKVWLLQFAYHRTINRKDHLEAKRFYAVEELREELLPAEIYNGPGRTLQLSVPEIVHLIEQMLGTIKPRQRRTIELTYFEGFTAEEIAAQTGETVDVVRHNLYRGLKKLKSALTEAAPSERKEKTGKVEGILFAHPRPF
jgi:RNA polymerase sigma-70 factor (ECF subfamily)